MGIINGGLTCKEELPGEEQGNQLEQHMALMGIFHPEWEHNFSMVEEIHMHPDHVIHAWKKGINQRSVTVGGGISGVL